jgi:hypothetical protein
MTKNKLEVIKKTKKHSFNELLTTKKTRSNVKYKNILIHKKYNNIDNLKKYREDIILNQHGSGLVSSVSSYFARKVLYLKNKFRTFKKMCYSMIMKLYIFFRLSIITKEHYNVTKALLNARLYFEKIQQYSGMLLIEFYRLNDSDNSIIKKIRYTINKIFIIQEKINSGIKNTRTGVVQLSSEKILKYIKEQDKYRMKLIKYCSFNDSSEFNDNCKLKSIREKLTLGYYTNDSEFICKLTKYRHIELYFNLYYTKFESQFQNFLTYYPNCQGLIEKIQILRRDLYLTKKESDFDLSKCAIDQINTINRKATAKAIDEYKNYLPAKFKERTYDKSEQLSDSFIKLTENFSELMTDFNNKLKVIKDKFEIIESFGVHRYWGALPKTKSIIGISDKSIKTIGNISQLSNDDTFKEYFQKSIKQLAADAKILLNPDDTQISRIVPNIYLKKTVSNQDLTQKFTPCTLNINGVDIPDNISKYLSPDNTIIPENELPIVLCIQEATETMTQRNSNFSYSFLENKYFPVCYSQYQQTKFTVVYVRKNCIELDLLRYDSFSPVNQSPYFILDDLPEDLPKLSNERAYNIVNIIFTTIKNPTDKNQDVIDKAQQIPDSIGQVLNKINTQTSIKEDFEEIKNIILKEANVIIDAIRGNNIYMKKHIALALSSVYEAYVNNAYKNPTASMKQLAIDVCNALILIAQNKVTEITTNISNPNAINNPEQAAVATSKAVFDEYKLTYPNIPQSITSFISPASKLYDSIKILIGMSQTPATLPSGPGKTEYASPELYNKEIMTVVNVHLVGGSENDMRNIRSIITYKNDEGLRKVQLGKIKDAIDKYADPACLAFICGDFGGFPTNINTLNGTNHPSSKNFITYALDYINTEHPNKKYKLDEVTKFYNNGFSADGFDSILTNMHIFDAHRRIPYTNPTNNLITDFIFINTLSVTTTTTPHSIDTNKPPISTNLSNFFKKYYEKKQHFIISHNFIIAQGLFKKDIKDKIIRERIRSIKGQKSTELIGLYTEEQLKNLIDVIDKLMSNFSYGKLPYLKRDFGCLNMKDERYGVRKCGKNVSDNEIIDFYTLGFPSVVEVYLFQLSKFFNKSNTGPIYYSENQLSSVKNNVEFKYNLRMFENMDADIPIRMLLIPSTHLKLLADIDYNIDNPTDFKQLSKKFCINFYRDKARNNLEDFLDIILHESSDTNLIVDLLKINEGPHIMGIDNHTKILLLYQFMFTNLRLKYLDVQIQKYEQNLLMQEEPAVKLNTISSKTLKYIDQLNKTLPIIRDNLIYTVGISGLLFTKKYDNDITKFTSANSNIPLTNLLEPALKEFVDNNLPSVKYEEVKGAVGLKYLETYLASKINDTIKEITKSIATKNIKYNEYSTIFKDENMKPTKVLNNILETIYNSISIIDENREVYNNIKINLIPIHDQLKNQLGPYFMNFIILYYHIYYYSFELVYLKDSGIITDISKLKTKIDKFTQYARKIFDSTIKIIGGKMTSDLQTVVEGIESIKEYLYGNTTEIQLKILPYFNSPEYVLLIPGGISFDNNDIYVQQRTFGYNIAVNALLLYMNNVKSILITNGFSNLVDLENIVLYIGMYYYLIIDSYDKLKSKTASITYNVVTCTLINTVSRTIYNIILLLKLQATGRGNLYITYLIDEFNKCCKAIFSDTDPNNIPIKINLKDTLMIFFNLIMYFSNYYALSTHNPAYSRNKQFNISDDYHSCILETSKLDYLHNVMTMQATNADFKQNYEQMLSQIPEYGELYINYIKIIETNENFKIIKKVVISTDAIEDIKNDGLYNHLIIYQNITNTCKTHIKLSIDTNNISNINAQLIKTIPDFKNIGEINVNPNGFGKFIGDTTAASDYILINQKINTIFTVDATKNSFFNTMFTEALQIAGLAGGVNIKGSIPDNSKAKETASTEITNPVGAAIIGNLTLVVPSKGDWTAYDAIRNAVTNTIDANGANTGFTGANGIGTLIKTHDNILKSTPNFILEPKDGNILSIMDSRELLNACDAIKGAITGLATIAPADKPKTILKYIFVLTLLFFQTDLTDISGESLIKAKKISMYLYFKTMQEPANLGKQIYNNPFRLSQINKKLIDKTTNINDFANELINYYANNTYTTLSSNINTIISQNIINYSLCFAEYSSTKLFNQIAKSGAKFKYNCIETIDDINFADEKPDIISNAINVKKVITNYHKVKNACEYMRYLLVKNGAADNANGTLDRNILVTYLQDLQVAESVHELYNAFIALYKTPDKFINDTIKDDIDATNLIANKGDTATTLNLYLANIPRSNNLEPCTDIFNLVDDDNNLVTEAIDSLLNTVPTNNIFIKSIVNADYVPIMIEDPANENTFFNLIVQDLYYVIKHIFDITLLNTITDNVFIQLIKDTVNLYKTNLKWRLLGLYNNMSADYYSKFWEKQSNSQLCLYDNSDATNIAKNNYIKYGNLIKYCNAIVNNISPDFQKYYILMQNDAVNLVYIRTFRLNGTDSLLPKGFEEIIAKLESESKYANYADNHFYNIEIIVNLMQEMSNQCMKFLADSAIINLSYILYLSTILQNYNSFKYANEIVLKFTILNDYLYKILHEIYIKNENDSLNDSKIKNIIADTTRKDNILSFNSAITFPPKTATYANVLSHLIFTDSNFKKIFDFLTNILTEETYNFEKHKTEIIQSKTLNDSETNIVKFYKSLTDVFVKINTLFYTTNILPLVATPINTNNVNDYMKYINQLMPYYINNNNLRTFATYYFIELFKMYTNILNLNKDYTYDINTFENIIKDYEQTPSINGYINNTLNYYLYNLNDLLSSSNPIDKAHFYDTSNNPGPYNIFINPPNLAVYYDILTYDKQKKHDFISEFANYNFYNKNTDSQPKNNNKIIIKEFINLHTVNPYTHSKILYTDTDHISLDVNFINNIAKLFKGKYTDILQYRNAFLLTSLLDTSFKLNSVISKFSQTVKDSIAYYVTKSGTILTGGRKLLIPRSLSHKTQKHKTQKHKINKRQKTRKTSLKTIFTKLNDKKITNSKRKLSNNNVKLTKKI